MSKTHHFSYIRTKYDTSKKFEVLYKVKHLRTFLPLELYIEDLDLYITKKVRHDLLLMLRSLHVLSLSHYANLTELPESIGDFKHLRHLDVSCTKLRGCLTLYASCVIY